MNRLHTQIGKIQLRNPVVCTSGCFGHGYEAADYIDLSKVGAIALKTVTMEPRKGNPTPRIHEVHAGMMSSIGLQNPGIEVYASEIMPKSQEVLDADQIIVSVAGNGADEYLKIVEKMNSLYTCKDIAALEVNTACPNVKCGGGAISKNVPAFSELMREIVRMSEIPIIVKIGTDFDAFCESAKAAEAAGVQAISTTNTPVAMAIDIKTGKTATGNLKAPISGPAIKPIGIGKTWDLYKAVNIPIIASGGITNMEDAIEYMMAGATAVGVGCASFVDPDVAEKIVRDMITYVEDNGLNTIHEIIGFAHKVRG